MNRSNTCSSEPRLPRTHLIPPASFLLVSFKIYPFFQQIQKFNTDSSKCSPLDTILTNKTQSMRNRINVERICRYLMFVFLYQVSLATIEPNHGLNCVNNLLSRPAINTINSSTDNPLHKQAYFTHIF